MAQTFTVDVESDWGGRSNSIEGIKRGIPFILREFKRYKIRGVFFISTKYLDKFKDIIWEIIRECHAIGSHGHEHRKFDTYDGWFLDYQKSAELIYENFGITISFDLYRSPWFSHSHKRHVYNNRDNHVSILKHSWFPQRITDNSIFYIHPFDFIASEESSPNLICELLYCHPRKVRDAFIKRLSEAV